MHLHVSTCIWLFIPLPNCVLRPSKFPALPTSHTQNLPASPPPPYSCRSGLSMLLCVAAAEAHSAQQQETLPFRMSMKRRSWLDEVYHVVTLLPLTMEQVGASRISATSRCDQV